MSDHAKERQIPAILIVVGLGLYVLGAFLHAGTGGVGGTLVAVLIGGAIQTAILIGAAFIVSSLMSVSFGDPPTAALKFAGATLAAGGLGAVIPIGGISALFVFLGLIMWLFELELTYAVVLTIVYFVVAIMVGILLRSAMA